MSSLLTKLFAGFLLCCMQMSFARYIPFYSSDASFNDRQHCRASVRHIEAGGIGYNQGYTTLESFLSPYAKSWKWMPFLDLRGHVFNNGKFATNIGLGLRTIERNRVYGLNVYYDYRDTKRYHYNQIGFGVETLGKRLDFRINGYLPIEKEVICSYKTEFDKFLDHQMIVLQKYQVAMKGAHAELGIHFGKSRFGKSPWCDFYAAAGTYYFTGKVGHHAWGGKGRLVAKFKEYWTIELSNSYDKVFHNRFQWQLSFTVPFGGGSHKESLDDQDADDMSQVLLSRMVQPVERQEIVVVERVNKCSTAIDPSTGKSYNVVFVDNNSHSLGTFKSPYPTLALAQDNSQVGDIIYVLPGDGTTKGMDAGITLQNNQKLWGSGIDHSLKTSLGNIIVPAQSSSTPQMTNTVGDGVTLALVNQVSGMNITGVAGNGINGAHVQDIEISKCTIASGDAKAIVIDSTASSMSCTVSDCIIQDNSSAEAMDASSSYQATFNFINNTIERNGHGCIFDLAGSSTLVVSGNTFNDNGLVLRDLAPLVVTAGADPVWVTVADNRIHGNVGGGVQCALNNTDAAHITLSNNTFTNNNNGTSGFGGPIWINPNSTTLGNCYLNLTENTFSDNSRSVLFCTNGSFNKFQVNALRNTLTGSAGGGFVFDNPCTTFTFIAKNNTISNGGDHGITTNNQNMTTVNMTISNNKITGNTSLANGISLSHVGTDLNLIVANNDISNNAGSGILLYSSSAIENVDVKIANNTINNNRNEADNQAGGIDLEQYTHLSGTITNNTLSQNVSAGHVSPGVYIGSTDTSPSACVTMSGNDSNDDSDPGYVGYTLSTGTGSFNLAPCDVTTVNVGSLVMSGAVNIVQSCPDGIPCT